MKKYEVAFSLPAGMSDRPLRVHEKVWGGLGATVCPGCRPAVVAGAIVSTVVWQGLAKNLSNVYRSVARDAISDRVVLSEWGGAAV
ncbi:hypothetical protein [Collinsella ihumii]|uniref:hypothetical protein n=1 Tax=Collinsella ihumii TaxID=1720204 RepID=UPI00137A0A89|nr:hypothetical protein [Collinsella ihumii]MCF6413713.1 hypothetical protein [Collinsella tanakaei]